MSTSIPDKVAAEAKRIYFQRCDEVDRLAQDFEEQEVLDLICRALMTERERAAEIALRIAHDHEDARDACLSEGPPNTKGALTQGRQMQIAHAIASAIRNGG